MSSNQVISRNQLCFGKFEEVAPHFCTILILVQKVGFYKILSANTRVYSKLVEEFYLNRVVADGVITSKVNNITVTFGSRELGILLGFTNEGENNFDSVNTMKGLEFMGYKKNPN